MGEKSGENLLLLLLVIHQAGTVAASLCHSNAILVAQLVGLLHQLLHLLHDGLVLLLILLLVGHRLLLRLLVARGEVRNLLGGLLVLGPRVRNLITTDRSSTTLLLLSLSGSFLQFLLKFVK